MHVLVKGTLVLLIAVFFAGCQSMQNGIGKWQPFAGGKAETSAEPDFGQPVRMAVIWKDATLQTPGKPTTRGFGGRVYLYDANNQPIRAEGELVVYGYDNSDKNEKANADRKYIIRESELQTHYSDAGIGPSYSVWIPWDRVGGEQKTVALIPMFRARDGRTLKGGQAITILPGKTPSHQEVVDESSAPYKVLGHSPAVTNASIANPASSVAHASLASSQGDVQRAAFVGPPETAEGIRTQTITVPNSMAERIHALPQQELSKVIERYRRRPATTAGPATELQTGRESMLDTQPAEGAKAGAVASGFVEGKAWFNKNPFGEGDQKSAKSSELQAPPVFGQPGALQ